MEHKVRRNRELRLGLPQLIILLGLVTGSMAAAFYLGFFAGKKAGYDNALSNMVASLPKLPIPDKKEIDEQVIESGVYAKLQETKNKVDESKENIPSLGVIPTSEINQIKTKDLKLPDTEPKPETKTEVLEMKSELPKIAINQDAQDKINEENLDSLVVTDNVEEEILTTPVPTLIKEIKESKKTAAETATPISKPTIQPTPKQIPKETPKEAATKKPTPLPTPTVKPNKANLPKGWYAQIASPKTMEEAQSLAKRLKNSGFPAVIEKVDDYYRVLSGPEDSKSLANTMVQQIKRERYISAEPFLRQVK